MTTLAGARERPPTNPPPEPPGDDVWKPRWIWIMFAVVALVTPLVGLWMEARR